MDFVVIMAGGTGKRLWPLSRKTHPKQVIKLFDGQTLLRRCFERLVPIFDPRNIIVLTNAGFVNLVRENIPELPYSNVIAEPVVRDTAGAIGLASTVISKYDPNATMAVVSADQLIRPSETLRQGLQQGLKFVNQNPESMITFGIQPDSPNTNLGYIKYSKGMSCSDCEMEIFKVDAFKEKPDEETARKYVMDGNYLWNAGMFIWKAKTILAHLRNFLPEVSEPLDKIKQAWDTPNQEKVLSEHFAEIPKISIDYAVMEKAEKVYTIKLECQWYDMGSFAALADIISSDENNNIVVAEKNELINCKNSIVITEDKDHLIAAIGLENVVIAHSPDATLICSLNQVNRIKDLLGQLEKHDGEKYL